MPRGEFRVPAGREVKLSLANASRLGGKIVALRTKSARALKTVAGLQLERPALFSDAREYEAVRDTRAFTLLREDACGKIGGLSAALVRAVLSALPVEERMPRFVQLEQRQRRVHDQDDQAVVRLIDFKLPLWILSLAVYVETIQLDTTIIEPNATLNLGPDVRNLRFGNLLMHEGARITGGADFLFVNVQGKLQGSLA